jgi:hypothetical protein
MRINDSWTVGLLTATFALLGAAVSAYAQAGALQPQEVIEVHQTFIDNIPNRPYSVVYRTSLPQEDLEITYQITDLRTGRFISRSDHRINMSGSTFERFGGAFTVSNPSPRASGTDAVRVDVGVASNTYPIGRVFTVLVFEDFDAEDDHDVVTIPEHGVLRLEGLPSIPTLYARHHGFLAPDDPSVTVDGGEGSVNYIVNLGEMPKDFTYCIPWGDRTRCWTK